eukprot:12215808-Ditylum_brightwellii.AAC.1
MASPPQYIQAKTNATYRFLAAVLLRYTDRSRTKTTIQDKQQIISGIHTAGRQKQPKQVLTESVIVVENKITIQLPVKFRIQRKWQNQQQIVTGDTDI